MEGKALSISNNKEEAKSRLLGIKTKAYKTSQTDGNAAYKRHNVNKIRKLRFVNKKKPVSYKNSQQNAANHHNES